MLSILPLALALLVPQAGNVRVIDAETKQPIVDKNAGELVTDSTMDQSGRNRGVDAAGKAENHLFITDLLTDPIDCILDNLSRRP